MRVAIVAKQTAKVCVLVITAVSEMALWLGLPTMVVRSVTKIVRLAIIAKSLANVLELLITAMSEAAL